MNRAGLGAVLPDVSDSGSTQGAVSWVLRVLMVACLGISAYVHLHLAHLYTTLGDTITMGQLFKVQGVVAAAVALWLLVTGSRFAWWAGAAVSAASFAAVMLYRYVDIGAIGPLPNMYDAAWQPSPDKLLSAIVEGAGVVLFLVWLLVSRPRRVCERAQPALSRSG